MEYDREYQRLRMRRLERENEALRELNTKLIRMLALACEIAVGGTSVSPTMLCTLVEEMA